MHRNTLLLTASLAVIAALVVGINIGRSVSTNPLPTPTPTATAAPSPITVRTYTSAKCGISLSYPSNLEVQESTTSATAFIDAEKMDQSVLLVCQPDIPRVPLTADKIESMTIRSETTAATIAAKLYHDTNAKDGTPIDKLIFTNAKKGVDVFLGGYGSLFQQIISSLKLL